MMSSFTVRSYYNGLMIFIENFLDSCSLNVYTNRFGIRYDKHRSLHGTEHIRPLKEKLI